MPPSATMTTCRLPMTVARPAPIRSTTTWNVMRSAAKNTPATADMATVRRLIGPRATTSARATSTRIGRPNRQRKRTPVAGDTPDHR